jgi:hypothetical protein
MGLRRMFPLLTRNLICYTICNNVDNNVDNNNVDNKI